MAVGAWQSWRGVGVQQSLSGGREPSRVRGGNPAGWDVVPKPRVLEAVRPNAVHGSGVEESFAYIGPANSQKPTANGQ